MKTTYDWRHLLRNKKNRYHRRHLSVSFGLPQVFFVERAFIICSGLCACTEMVWMCVLYVTFGLPWVAMGRTVLFILRSKLLLYSVGFGVNRVQVVLSRFSVGLLCVSVQKLYVDIVVCISWLHDCLCV